MLQGTGRPDTANTLVLFMAVLVAGGVLLLLVDRIRGPRRDEVRKRPIALWLEARRDHAGLVSLRTWYVLIFPTWKLTVSLVDAFVYRRVP